MIVGLRGRSDGREPDPVGVVREGPATSRPAPPARCRSTTARPRSAKARSRPSSVPSRSRLGPLRRSSRRRAGHRRLPRRVTVRVHRRHAAPDLGQRQRRAVHRPRASRRDAPQGSSDGGDDRAPRVLERHRDEQAIVDFVERVTTRVAPTTSRRSSGSPCSTTTARSGARSRCRSSSASSSSDSPRWRSRRVAPRAPALEGRPREGLRLARRRDHEALPRRRQPT